VGKVRIMSEEICGQCNGDGIVDQTITGSFDDDLPDYLSCTVCDGTGKVNQNGDYFPPEIVCPICGSTDIDVRQDMRSMNPLGAGLIFIDQFKCHCKDCNAEGDFSNDNDLLIEEAIKEAITKRAIQSLDILAENGQSTAWIERCLGLNIGTFKKYKEQNVFPREAYVLLRFIECQPELLTLAKLNYPPKWLLTGDTKEALGIEE